MLHAEGLDELIAERLNIWSRAPELATVAAHRRALQEARREGAVKIGVVGKYVHLQGRVQVAPRGARPRRPRATTARSSSSTSTPSRSSSRGPRSSSRTSTRCSSPAASATAGPRGRSRRSGTRARTGSRSSGSASGCSSRSSSSRGTSPGSRARTRASSTRTRRTPVIDLMPEQRGLRNKGATMRLGAYPCAAHAGLASRRRRTGRRRSASATATATSSRTTTASSSPTPGLVLSGTSPDKRLVEMIELRDHPFFVGCQFHPEFKSRPAAPHPLFARFVRAALERQLLRGKTETRRQPETKQSENQSTVN